MSDHTNLHFDSKCVHAGISDNEFGAVVPAIYQTSTFKFKSSAHGASLFSGAEEGHIYTRMSNPTVNALESALAELEGGAAALGCASGMAAIHTLFAAVLQAGDHVVCSSSVYGPTITLLGTLLKKFNISATFTHFYDPEEVERAFTPATKLVFVESPGNPTLEIIDLKLYADMAHKHGALFAVDNTFMSPALQNPFELGTDIIVHSMTKFLNGHADVIAGVIILKSKEQYPAFRKTLNQLGGVIDPFNSFLVHRGLKTLSIRMQRHCENAMIIAEYLEKHPKVESVTFPGLPSHPNYELGKKQMSGPGGMIAFELKGGIEAGRKMMDNVKLCQLAVSLGGVETLIQHPASMTHLSMGEEARKAAGITEGMVRLSVGIENVNDLIADLEQALAAV